MEQENYKLIVTIVSRGKSAKVLNIARQAGAVGGTILSGHGASVRLMLGISIEPEKDIVLSLMEESKVTTVVDALEKGMMLNEPNRGIAFVISLDQVVGLYQE